MHKYIIVVLICFVSLVGFFVGLDYSREEKLRLLATIQVQKDALRDQAKAMESVTLVLTTVRSAMVENWGCKNIPPVPKFGKNENTK